MHLFIYNKIMLYSILLSVALTLLIIISLFFLYIRNTKKLSSEIKLDFVTLNKSFNKSNNIKNLSKTEITITTKQITLLRSSIESFNKRFFLSSNQKKSKDIFRNKMINLEVLYTQLKL